MQTECSPTLFEFEPVERHKVVAGFDGGIITSDAGGLLLGRLDRGLGLIRRMASCFTDRRDPRLLEHTVETLVGQRVFALALGYEDLNDHDELRHDPLFHVLAGKLEAKRSDCAPVAGKSTLNRLEHRPRREAGKYHKIDYDAPSLEALFVDIFLDGHKRAPKEIVLDLDATDDTIHGEQEGRFFHGYYDSYCYLPLYIFCGRFLLGAKLRPANIDGAAGAVDEVARIVARIRARWPKVRIVLRGDSGFCREELMAWCEAEGVAYLFGLAPNARLKAVLAPEAWEAARLCRTTGKAARLFRDFAYQTETSWSRPRRVVGKAEHLPDGANPRFVVTSLGREKIDARGLCDEDLYCARGEMENRIKECQLDLFADRTSSATMQANATAPVVRVDGLRAAQRVAPDRAPPHPVCRCHLRHHPAEAVEDRCPGPSASGGSSSPWPRAFPGRPSSHSPTSICNAPSRDSRARPAAPDSSAGAAPRSRTRAATPMTRRNLPKTRHTINPGPDCLNATQMLPRWTTRLISYT